MDDLISRQAAINWIINLSADIGKIQHQDLWHYEQALDEIRALLEHLPTAEPKKGKWKHRKTWSMYVCDQCSFENREASRFCPNCGARMTEESDGNSD